MAFVQLRSLSLYAYSNFAQEYGQTPIDTLCIETLVFGLSTCICTFSAAAYRVLPSLLSASSKSRQSKFVNLSETLTTTGPILTHITILLEISSLFLIIENNVLFGRIFNFVAGIVCISFFYSIFVFGAMLLLWQDLQNTEFGRLLTCGPGDNSSEKYKERGSEVEMKGHSNKVGSTPARHIDKESDQVIRQPESEAANNKLYDAGGGQDLLPDTERKLNK